MNKASVSSIALLLGLSNYALYSHADEQKSAEDTFIEEVLVTASKRGAQSVQDTPYNISAVGADAIEKNGISNLTELSRTVAGLEVIDQGPSNKTLVIRGLTTSAGATQVSTYLDEIPVSATDSEYRLYDIERVEVLRGPQGTLYGDGSQGGTVRYITRRPNHDEVEGSVELDLGKVNGGGNETSVQAMLNVPLIDDTLSLRAVVGRLDNDGLVNRPDLQRSQSDRFKNNNSRLQLLWDMNDSTDLLLAYHSQDVTVEDGTLVGVDNNDVPGFVRNPFGRDSRHINVTLNHETDVGTLTFSGSDSQRRGHFSFDVSAFNPVPYSVSGPSNVDTRSYELRFASDFSGPIQLVSGLYYQDYDAFSLSISGPIDLQSGVLPGDYNPRSIPEPVGQNFLLDQFDQRETRAIFGELSYDLNEKLNVLVGVRRFEIDTNITHIVSTANDIFGRPLGYTTDVDSTDKDTVFKILVSYDVNEDVLLYGTRSEGFRQGGANVLFDPTDTRSETSYRPDYVTNYELGAKLSLADGQLIVNSAVYLMEWDDIQVELLEATRPNEFVTNLGSARLYGWELESTYSPASISGLKFSFGLTLSKQELREDSLDNVGNPFANKGDPIPNAISDSAFIGVEQRFTAFDQAAYVNVTASYTGESQTDFAENSFRNRRWGDFVSTNVSAGLDSETWSLIFYANNLFDDRSPLGWSSTYSPSAGVSIDNIYITRPRTLGIKAQYRF
ncbi:TonB-dependent receptor [Pseudoteredinibacter isoporae]|uniref:TonB-dependent receptor n=1 Tax=Pseudoteredinibacter isoporae TaxID=570281 RepID=UPI003107E2CE